MRVGFIFENTEIAGNKSPGVLKRMLLITAIGSSIIRMVPPLILTREDCDKAFAILKETVEAQ